MKKIRSLLPVAITGSEAITVRLEFIIEKLRTFNLCCGDQVNSLNYLECVQRKKSRLNSLKL